jgi:hypothetical protein
MLRMVVAMKAMNGTPRGQFRAPIRTRQTASCINSPGGEPRSASSDCLDGGELELIIWRQGVERTDDFVGAETFARGRPLVREVCSSGHAAHRLPGYAGLPPAFRKKTKILKPGPCRAWTIRRNSRWRIGVIPLVLSLFHRW